MQFGLYAPVPHVTVGSDLVRSSIASAMDGLPPGVVDAQMLACRETVLRAEASGFDIVLVAERHRGPDMEAWILASALASLTSRIKIMPAVHPGLWHPTLIAKMAASLDRIAPGRSAINIVTGWNEAEARMFGGDVLLGGDQRYERAEEFVGVLRGMWNRTPFSFAGSHYQVDASELLLKPAGHVELFAASRSERGLDMVARCADWWFVGHDPAAKDAREIAASLRIAIDDMNERADRFGRRVRYAFNPFVALGDDAKAARVRVEKLLLAAAADADRARMLDYIGPAMRAGCIGEPARVRNQGAPIRIVINGMGQPPYAFYAKPAIKQIADLKGKLVSIGGSKDITLLYTEAFVASAGLKAKDLDFVYAKATPDRFAALAGGAVDAAMLYPPFTFRAAAQGFSPLGDIEPHMRDFPFTVWATNTRWAESNRPALNAYVKAYGRAVRWLYNPDNKEEAVDILVSFAKGDRKDAAETYDYFVTKLNGFSKDGIVSEAIYKRMSDGLVSLGDLSDPVPQMDKFFDTSFVRAAWGEAK